MNDWLNWILLAADSFIVKNTAERIAVIAGYHWFESWGRDTFISLPGLMLVTGRFSYAKDVLQNFIQYCQMGLIPNLVGDRTGVPLYNTVDGTLWYINAVLQYLKYTGDFGFVKDELWESLQAIVEYHKRGTMFGIHVDDDGLLMHGAGLTWMDAKVGAQEITPRSGKAVEVQALWFNALRTMEKLAQKFEQKDSAATYASMADQASLSFNKKFWNSQAKLPLRHLRYKRCGCFDSSQSDFRCFTRLFHAGKRKKPKSGRHCKRKNLQRPMAYELYR